MLFLTDLLCLSFPLVILNPFLKSFLNPFGIPDCRAEVCFDNATRANLGGLDHSGRIFLALALLYRYKSSKRKEYFKNVLSILTKKEQILAKILGKAMRFGAMLSGSIDNNMGELS